MTLPVLDDTIECQCDDCKSACSHRPGWFAPGEAEKAAAYLNMTLEEFFQKHLSVDYWVDIPNIYVLAPASDKSVKGGMYPEDPTGVCTFLKDGLCTIHTVKPYECKHYDHTKEDSAHESVGLEWKDHQDQILATARTQTMSGQCKDCIFFLNTMRDGGRAGDCRRYPPQVVFKGYISPLNAEFPHTYKNGWCGEFKPKKGEA